MLIDKISSLQGKEAKPEMANLLNKHATSVQTHTRTHTQIISSVTASKNLSQGAGLSLLKGAVGSEMWWILFSNQVVPMRKTESSCQISNVISFNVTP